MTLPVLRGQRVSLRPFRPDDVEALVAGLNDFETVRHLAIVPFPYTRAHAEEFIASAEGKGPLAVGHAFAVERHADQALLGCVSIHPGAANDRERTGIAGTGVLGYWFARPYWRQGYAGEAVPIVIDYGFSSLSLRRIIANADLDNPGLQRILVKCGLEPMGTVLSYKPARREASPSIFYVLQRDRWAARAAKPIVHVAAVVLIDADDRVLLAQRPPGKSMAGLWEFPGGKIEPGETPEVALIRELREELGIDTEASCLAPLTFASHGYANFHLVMPLYVCRVWTGTPRAREHAELTWVPIPRLSEYPMPPADVPLVAMIRDYL